MCSIVHLCKVDQSKNSTNFITMCYEIRWRKYTRTFHCMHKEWALGPKIFSVTQVKRFRMYFHLTAIKSPTLCKDDSL